LITPKGAKILTNRTAATHLRTLMTQPTDPFLTGRPSDHRAT